MMKEALFQVHDVFGNDWSYKDLKQFIELKVYHDSNHDKRSLQKAPNGMLFLYDFHEEMGFPNDSIYEHYFVVKNEDEAESLKDASLSDLKLTKKWLYIAPDYSFFIKR